MLMIKILSAAIPDDWVIYIKEHPTQWFERGLGYTRFRWPGYYEAMAKIKKVKFVDMETPASELIKRSQAVATVTGTAGREAIFAQRPALIFGYTTYRDCEGAFYINDLKSCKAVIDKINSGYKINQQEVLNYFISLDKTSFHTFFEPIIENKSKLSTEEHIVNIFNAIIDDIENNTSQSLPVRPASP